MPGARKRTKKVFTENQSKQIKKKIDRALNSRAENKIHIVDVSGSISTTVAFNQVSLVTQGQTDIQRIGDELYVKSLHWNWAFVGNDATNRMRLLVFQWHGDSAINQPLAGDIFQSNTTTGYFGQLRKDQKQMFTVLYDNFISTHTYSMIRHAQVNMYKGFRKKIMYQAAGTAGTNHIYTCLVSDSAGTGHPAIDSQFCVRYYDS